MMTKNTFKPLFLFMTVMLLMFSYIFIKPIYAQSFDGQIILGRPENDSITASITTPLEKEIYLQWGNQTGKYTNKTEVLTSNATMPAVFKMTGLTKNSKYYYRVCYKAKDETNFSYGEENSFSTPKEKGVGYNFTIQADSHLKNKADKQLYELSMQNMAKLSPDFVFDLGDTFINDQVDDLGEIAYETVDATVREQLPFFDIVAKNSPLFLVIGNHEGEMGGYIDGTKDNLTAKSTIARTKYFQNPIPDNFYTGNTEKEPLIGAPQNYYAYTWGDALYVAIDPYRYSQVDPYGSEGAKANGWDWTLGKQQYDWFRKTLETSDAKYKFVFSHHAIGNFRGGAEIASLYEWGGYDQKGKYLFDEKRPGFGKPIQQIMEDTNVTIFFQGHDHVFSRETVGNVTYVTMPKPAEKVADKQNNISSYENGDTLLNSGFLNVNVTPEKVQVDYNRNFFVASGEQAPNTGVVYSFTIDSTGKTTVLKNTKDDLSTYGKNAESISNTKESGIKVKEEKVKEEKIKEEKVKEEKETKQQENTGDVITGVGANPKDGISTVLDGGYSFAIFGDPHWDENTSQQLYNQTAENVLSAKPSFLIDLGDNSMVEKLAKTDEEIISRFELAKNNYAFLGKTPLYVVTGNHDGENGSYQKAEAVRELRQKYFPIPTSSKNLSGNTKTANYYQFTKGDAQFIVLDPFTNTTRNGGGWNSTLGKTQYDWLKNTLATSKSKYKFVFVHHMVGGNSKDQRGGAEASTLYEWGGLNENGVDEFSKMRPDFDMPIHDLLLKYNVNAVFHGHDHFYAKQERDGIIYQLAPQPGTPGNSVSDATNYGYLKGTFLPSAGFLNVSVSKEGVTVDYAKTDKDGKIIVPDSYTIK